MTVDSQKNKISYVPDGIEDTFAFDFRVDEASDMVVYADNVLYAGGRTVTDLTDPNGGTVVFDVAPLSTIADLTLVREVPLTQETKYPALGPFPAPSHEAALDKLTFAAQQLQEQVSRAGIAPIDADPLTDFTLPKYAAGEVWLWDLTQRKIVTDIFNVTVDIAGVLTADTMAALRTLTPSAENPRAALLGYYALGDGGGGPEKYGAYGEAPGTYVDTGGSVIVPNGGDGSAAWLWPDGYEGTFEEWGCVGDGVADDSIAFLKALTYGGPLTGKEGAVYLLSTWTAQKIAVVNIYGKNNFTIRGTASTQLLTLSPDITIDGVKFDTWERVVYKAFADTEVVKITNLTVQNCHFSAIGYPVDCLANGTVSDFVSKNVNLVNNEVDDCGGGFRMNFPIYGYTVQNNIFRTLNSDLSPISRTSAIIMGMDTIVAGDDYQNQGGGIISGNKCYDVTSTTGTGEANFIQVFGSNVSITNNFGKNLSSTALDDAEGIYFKGSHFAIIGNQLLDCGSFEAAIKVKGYSARAADTSRILSEDNIIANNYVKFTGTLAGQASGISCNTGNVIITGNRVINPNLRGIIVSEQNPDNADSEFSIVSNNVIKGLNGAEGGTPHGIAILGSRDIIVESNIVQMDTQYDVTMYGMSVANTNFALGRNIKLINNTIEAEIADDTSASVTTLRGIFVDQTRTEQIEDLTISGNNFSIQVDTMSVIDISISGTVVANLHLITNNYTRSSSASGSVTDITYGASAEPTKRVIRDNEGFTTVSPLKTGDTASRPALTAADAGYSYYDTDDAKMIYWNGAAWVNSDGTAA